MEALYLKSFTNLILEVSSFTFKLSWRLCRGFSRPGLGWGRIPMGHERHGGVVGRTKLRPSDVARQAQLGLNALQGEVDDEGSEGLHAVAEGIIHKELYDERVEHHVLTSMAQGTLQENWRNPAERNTQSELSG